MPVIFVVRWVGAVRCALRRAWLGSLGLCLLSASAAAQNPSPAAPVRYGDSPAAMAFADDLAERRGLDPAWVRQHIGAAQHLPSVVRLMTPVPKGTPKNWVAYRARFIEPIRLRAGQAFWQANRAALARAESEFGVPASLIVGVIGVETLYGRHTGQFRVIRSEERRVGKECR